MKFFLTLIFVGFSISSFSVFPEGKNPDISTLDGRSSHRRIEPVDVVKETITESDCIQEFSASLEKFDLLTNANIGRNFHEEITSEHMAFFIDKSELPFGRKEAYVMKEFCEEALLYIHNIRRGSEGAFLGDDLYHYLLFTATPNLRKLTADSLRRSITSGGRGLGDGLTSSMVYMKFITFINGLIEHIESSQSPLALLLKSKTGGGVGFVDTSSDDSSLTPSLTVEITGENTEADSSIFLDGFIERRAEGASDPNLEEEASLELAKQLQEQDDEKAGEEKRLQEAKSLELIKQLQAQETETGGGVGFVDTSSDLALAVEISNQGGTSHSTGLADETFPVFSRAEKDKLIERITRLEEKRNEPHALDSQIIPTWMPEILKLYKESPLPSLLAYEEAQRELVKSAGDRSFQHYANIKVLLDKRLYDIRNPEILSLAITLIKNSRDSPTHMERLLAELDESANSPSAVYNAFYMIAASLMI